VLARRGARSQRAASALVPRPSSRGSRRASPGVATGQTEARATSPSRPGPKLALVGLEARPTKPPYICYTAGVRRTTIFLPEEVHEQLRRDAYLAKTSMAELIRARLRRPVSPRRRGAPEDPIMKVAGVCRGPVLSSEIDESLYGR